MSSGHWYVVSSGADGSPCLKVGNVKTVNISFDSLLEINQKMRNPQTGVEVKDRKWLLKTYPQCFIASELVEWMIKQKITETREQAVGLSNYFSDRNSFHPVNGDHKFKDEDLYFAFDDLEASQKNITENKAKLSGRISTPAKPSLNSLIKQALSSSTKPATSSTTSGAGVTCRVCRFDLLEKWNFCPNCATHVNRELDVLEVNQKLIKEQAEKIQQLQGGDDAINEMQARLDELTRQNEELRTRLAELQNRPVAATQPAPIPIAKDPEPIREEPKPQPQVQPQPIKEDPQPQPPSPTTFVMPKPKFHVELPTVGNTPQPIQPVQPVQSTQTQPVTQPTGPSSGWTTSAPSSNSSSLQSSNESSTNNVLAANSNTTATPSTSANNSALNTSGGNQTVQTTPVTNTPPTTSAPSAGGWTRARIAPSGQVVVTAPKQPTPVVSTTTTTTTTTTVIKNDNNAQASEPQSAPLNKAPLPKEEGEVVVLKTTYGKKAVVKQIQTLPSDNKLKSDAELGIDSSDFDSIVSSQFNHISGPISAIITGTVQRPETLGSAKLATLFKIDVFRGQYEWTVFRRLGQFKDLDKSWKTRKVKVGPLPSFGKKESHDTKREAIEKYLHNLLMNDDTALHPILVSFLLPIQMDDSKPKKMDGLNLN